MSTSDATSALVFDRVNFAYGERPVLERLSFSIAAGETVALLGPSGCGKTTVLNLLAGFERPTGGHALAAGRPITGPGPDRGMVFQSYALFDWMTVEDNIAFSLRCAGRPVAEQRRVAREAAAMVGLQDVTGAYPYQLSGGMRQRCSLARVLAARPEVMLMDEPFAAVDIHTRERLQEEVLRIQAQAGITVVFVTHDIDEAVFLGQRIFLFEGPGGTGATRIREFTVDLPHPRASAVNRIHPRFLALRNEIYQAMHTLEATA